MNLDPLEHQKLPIGTKIALILNGHHRQMMVDHPLLDTSSKRKRKVHQDGSKPERLDHLKPKVLLEIWTKVLNMNSEYVL